MAPELVSVVIPAYHADRHLKLTLAGVAAQTHREWELIVVEDGSVTRTDQIVEEFAREHPNNRVVYARLNSNQGQGAARNRAIGLSNGNFIALLDSDDIWLPTHLAAAMRTLSSSGADIAYSTSVMFEDDTDHILGVWGPTHRELANFPIPLLKRDFITPSATVLRKIVFQKVGLFDATRELQGTEDFDLWLRAIVANIQFVLIGGVHCLYRKGHETAATSEGNMHKITRRFARVLNRHIVDIPKLDSSERKELLAECYATSGYFNINVDSNYSRKAFAKAWRLRPLKRTTTLFLIAGWIGIFAPRVPKFLKTVRDARRTRAENT